MEAFTLPQLIGALAVMAILASVIAPVAIKRMDQAARDGEASSLAAMAEAFTQAALNARTIPATTNTIPQLIANYMNEQTNTIRINKRGLTRVFLADPAASINGAGLPFVQTIAGASDTARPSGVRFLILSSVAKALPSINQANFNNFWTTAKGTVPTLLTNWGGSAEDLLLERIELGPMFHKIILMNVDRAPAVATYSIDSSSTTTVAGQTRFSAYYIKGTVLNMYRTDGTVDFREVIQEDFSLVYQNGKWGRELDAGENDEGTFGALVDNFLQGRCPCGSENGATQRAVVNAFYDYLWGYADWAFGDTSASPAIPPFAGSNTSFTPQYPSYTIVNDAAKHMGGQTASFTENLIK